MLEALEGTEFIQSRNNVFFFFFFFFIAFKTGFTVFRPLPL